MGIIKFISSALISLTLINSVIGYSEKNLEILDICSCISEQNCSNINSNSPSKNCQTFPIGYCITQVEPCSGEILNQHSKISTLGDQIIIDSFSDVDCNNKISSLKMTCGECIEYFNTGIQGLCNDNDNTNHNSSNNSLSSLEITGIVIGAFFLAVCSFFFLCIVILILIYLYRKYKESKYTILD